MEPSYLAKTLFYSQLLYNEHLCIQLIIKIKNFLRRISKREIYLIYKAII